MYNNLPSKEKSEINPLLLNDTQLSLVVKEFYKDERFGKEESGSINLWRLYNLFTDAAKTTYIDQFLDKSVNVFQLVEHLKKALENQTSSWYLN